MKCESCQRVVTQDEADRAGMLVSGRGFGTLCEECAECFAAEETAAQ